MKKVIKIHYKTEAERQTELDRYNVVQIFNTVDLGEHGKTEEILIRTKKPIRLVRFLFGLVGIEL